MFCVFDRGDEMHETEAGLPCRQWGTPVVEIQEICHLQSCFDNSQFGNKCLSTDTFAPPPSRPKTTCFMWTQYHGADIKIVFIMPGFNMVLVYQVIQNTTDAHMHLSYEWTWLNKCFYVYLKIVLINKICAIVIHMRSRKGLHLWQFVS